MSTISLLAETNAVVVCTNLSKVYEGRVTALRELNLRIERGMSFGLLGENGAGKSTLVRLIMGFILPTKGDLCVLGQHRVSLAHPQMGYLHERPYVELSFTARSYLTYLAQISGLWGKFNRQRVNTTLELVDLDGAGDEKLATYSKGMLQRLCIAQALLTDPEFLLLDEPTSGLDPYSQWKVRRIIAELRRQGKTILICSHYLAEVEMLCDTVGILQHGQMVQQGAVKDLVRTQDAVEILLQNDQLASEIVQLLGLGEQVLDTQQNLLKIRKAAQQEVLSMLVAAGVALHSLNPVSSTLEDVYIAVTRPEAERQKMETASLLHSRSTDGKE